MSQPATAEDIEEDTTITCLSLPPFNCNATSTDVLLRGKLKTCQGTLGAHPVKVLLDGGADAIFVKASLVKTDQYTGQDVCVRGALETEVRPLARITLKCPYFEGTVVAVTLSNPPADVILGRVPGTQFHEGKVQASNLLNGISPDQDESAPGPEDLLTPPTGSSSSNPPSGDTEQPGNGLTCGVTTRSQTRRELQQRPPNLPDLPPIATRSDLLKAQQECPSLQTLHNNAKSKREHPRCNGSVAMFIYRQDLLYRQVLQDGQQTHQLVVPQQYRQEILRLAHDNPLSGHYSQEKTLARLNRDFHWPGMTRDVTHHCHSCHTCQLHAPRRPPKAPMGTSYIASEPFSSISIDIVGQLSPASSKGNRYILTVVDNATRYADAAALRHIDADTVAEALFTICTRIGFPKTLVSDNGTQFTSNTFKAFTKLMDIKHKFTPPYHAQSNGLVERFNGTLKAMLRKLSAERPQDWDRHLPALLFAYRDAPQASTGYSPFELIYGHRVRGPLTYLKECWTTETVPTDEEKEIGQQLLDMRQRLEETCRIARENLKKSQATSKRYFDKRTKMRRLQPGDKVIIFLPDSPRKLTMSWQGPYTVECRLGTYTYKINVKGRSKAHHINLLRKYTEREAPEGDPEEPDEVADEVFASVALALEYPDDPLDGTDPTIPSSQTQTWQDCILSSDLSLPQQEETSALLQEYSHIFSDIPGKTNTLHHHIELLDSTSLKLQHSYPMPLALEPQLRQEIEQWLQLGIVEKSTSPYCSPLLAVRKKDGTHRFCLDCRQLNLQTQFDGEPVGDPDAIFHELAGASYLTRLDLTAGYWQVPLTEESKSLTAFKTRSGLYQFVMMPFGLSTAPATFSRLMRIVVQGIPHVYAYLDDLLVATPTWDEHLQALRILFDALSRHGLHAKPSKCEIGCEELQYLGHNVGRGHYRPLEARAEVLAKAPLPKTKKLLRSFLGSIGYYQRFIAQYATKTQPLLEFLKNRSPDMIPWTDVTIDLFNSLAKLLLSRPILQLPDSNLPFVLRTDASNVGLGAVLLQPNNRDPRVLTPVLYASRTLKAAELNYSVVEREALAVYWALQKMGLYLYGRQFELQTDHRPLLYLQTADRLNPRLKRWAIYIGLYRFTSSHIKGDDNHIADYLSRLPQV